MSPLAGSKRLRSIDPDEGLPYGDAEPSRSVSESRKEKPKDWRSAFLDEDDAEDRRRRERRREEDRNRHSHRSSTTRDGSRSRDRDSRPGAGRDRDRRELSREATDTRDPSSLHHRTPRSPSASNHRRRTRTPSPTRGAARSSYPPPRAGYAGASARGGAVGGGRGDWRGGQDSYRGRGAAVAGRGGRGDYNYHPSARPYNNQYPVSDPTQRNSTNAPPPPPPPPPATPVIIEPPKVEVIEEIPYEEELDPEEALAARRKKRQEILEKFQRENESAATSAAGTPAPSTAVSESGGLSVAAASRAISPVSPASPSGFVLAKADESLASVPQDSSAHANFQSVPDASEEISAADYDPSADRRADDIRRQQIESVMEPATAVQQPIQPKVEVVEEQVDDDDDDDDMFSDVIKTKKKPAVANGGFAVPVTRVAPLPSTSAATLSDNWDDADGYYRITPGEVIDDGRYQIYTTLGKGMFSAVVKARVLKASPDEPLGIDVAIKIIRSQESMYKAGLKEIQILNKLRAADPDDKKHLIRLDRTFEHRGHLCMVFENLSMNLRDVIKRFGKDVGLNIKAVRAYSHQLFLGLSLMHKCKIMHADIKPDNILVTENKSILKICDLGSASDESENDITPYLVSRFYRAPEIILGLPYDCSLDMWSIGCTLFELYTGKILFPGRTNNQMLLHHMELKGKFNHRIIKKSQFGEMHFDETMNFISVEVDKITGQNTSKILSSFKARDLKARLLPSAQAQYKMKDDELKLLLSFVDLLDKCLMLDSSKRISPREALMHPFIRGG